MKIPNSKMKTEDDFPPQSVLRTFVKMVGEFSSHNSSTPQCGPVGLRFSDWYSFLDLDNFNSDKLVANLTLHGDDGTPVVWKNLAFIAENNDGRMVIIALRQAEALFNLSQLMFALYHGSLQACTFLDLQNNRLPRDVRERGFTKLDDCNVKSGTAYRQALHSLCWDIVEAGGLPVIFAMIENPALPIIRQKCLDALTNVLCVDHVEWLVLTRQPWFLDKLVKMIEGGDLQCDMVPAISVLDRLVVVILSEHMKDAYQQLLDANFLQICIEKLQDVTYSRDSKRQHFVKFQTIAMQALALLCQDSRSSQWKDSDLDSVFAHAYLCTSSWNTEQPLTDPKWDKSESFYRTMSFSSSSLLFSLIILVHSVLKWPGKKEILQDKGLVFQYQLSRMMTLSFCESSASDANSPIIKNAAEWLLKTLFVEGDRAKTHHAPTENGLLTSVLDPLSELCEKVYRECSYRGCGRRETEIGRWELCPHCMVACYCSDACRVSDASSNHTMAKCRFLSMKDSSFEN